MHICIENNTSTDQSFLFTRINMLIDTHCHLDYFSEDEVDNIISNAFENGIKNMITISTKVSEFDKIIAIASKNDNIYCSIGNHPDNVHEEKTDVDYMLSMCNKYKDKIVGIGETGLDFYRSIEHRNIQIESFEKHIYIASETSNTLIVHNRSSDTEMIDIIKNKCKDIRGIIHCFTGDEALAKVAIDNGFFISLSGIITFKNAENLRDVVKKVPLESIIIETDSPFLAPVPHRGKRNEPSFVKHTAEYLADFFALDYEKFMNKMHENTMMAFPKLSPKQR